MTFSSAVSGACKTITFSGLASSDPYVKVRFTNATSATYTLLVHSREDVTATVTL